MFPWLKEPPGGELNNRSNVGSPHTDFDALGKNPSQDKSIRRQVVNTQILSNKSQLGNAFDNNYSKEYNPFYDNKYKDNQVSFMPRKEPTNKDGSVILDPNTHKKHEKIKGDYVEFVRDAMKVDRNDFNKKRYRKPDEIENVKEKETNLYVVNKDQPISRQENRSRSPKEQQQENYAKELERQIKKKEEEKKKEKEREYELEKRQVREIIENSPFGRNGNFSEKNFSRFQRNNPTDGILGSSNYEIQVDLQQSAQEQPGGGGPAMQTTYDVNYNREGTRAASKPKRVAERSPENDIILSKLKERERFDKQMKQSTIKEELEKQIAEKKLKKEEEKRELFIREIQEVERLKRENDELRERYLRELAMKQEANNQVGTSNKQLFEGRGKKGKAALPSINEEERKETLIKKDETGPNLELNSVANNPEQIPQQTVKFQQSQFHQSPLAEEENTKLMTNIYKTEDRTALSNVELSRLKRDLYQQKELFQDELSRLRAEASVSDEQRRQAQRDLIALRDELKRHEILEGARMRDIQQTMSKNFNVTSLERPDLYSENNKYASIFYTKDPKSYSKIIGNALPPKRPVEQRNLLAEEWAREQGEGGQEEDRALKYYENLMNGKSEPDFQSPYNSYNKSYIPDIIDSLKENPSYNINGQSNYSFRVDPNTGHLKNDLKGPVNNNSDYLRDLKRSLFSESDAIMRLDNLMASLN